MPDNRADNVTANLESDDPDDLFEVLWVSASTFLKGELVTREQCGGNFERWLHLGAIGPVPRGVSDALLEDESDLLESGLGNSLDGDLDDLDDDPEDADDADDPEDDIDGPGSNEEGLDGDQSPGAEGDKLPGAEQKGSRRPRGRRKAASEGRTTYYQ